MKQRTAIFLAMAMTAYVLVMVGAIAYSLTAQSNLPEINSSGALMLRKADVGPGEQIAVPAAQPTQLPAVPSNNSALLQPRLVTADRAAKIALALYPGAMSTKPPELVNYKGKMAYEVVLGGATVYVDAFTGNVLGNLAAVASNQPPPSDNGGNSGSNDDGAGNDPNSVSFAATQSDVPTDPQSPPSQDQPNGNDDGGHDQDDDAQDHQNEDPGHDQGDDAQDHQNEDNGHDQGDHAQDHQNEDNGHDQGDHAQDHQNEDNGHDQVD